jgi:chromate transporter
VDPPSEPTGRSTGKDQRMQRHLGLRAATRVWAGVGLNSFGGPAGQIAVMHREVVERHAWVSERRFLHALNFCMVLPGPEAQQLATYLGWLLHGVRGGLIAGVLFIAPGFVVMMGLAAAYALYGEVPWVAALLGGLQAAVVVIVAEAVVRVSRRALTTPLLRGVAVLAFVALFAFAAPFPAVVVAAALLGWLVGRSRADLLPPVGSAEDGSLDSTPHLIPDDESVDASAARGARRAAAIGLVLWLVPLALLVVLLGRDSVWSQIGLLFSTTAVVTFGGAYAVLSYISIQAVQTYGWLNAEDMAAGLGLAETTPGPLILVVQFVGFLAAFQQPGGLPPLLAGLVGGTLAVWVTFVPCFVFIFAGAPSVERLRGSRPLHHALTAVSAAVVGVIANLGVWFAVTVLFERTRTISAGPLQVLWPEWASINWGSAAITVLAAVLVVRFRLPTWRVLAACAGAGLLAGLAGLT